MSREGSSAAGTAFLRGWNIPMFQSANERPIGGASAA
jgi:hypothetical protein